MSEPLSRERREGLKRGVEQGHIDSTVITRADLESLLAAAERVAALEGLLREAHDYMERKGVQMNMGVEGAGLMERISKEVGR